LKPAFGILLCLLPCLPVPGAMGADDYSSQRRSMVSEVRALAELTRRETGVQAISSRVLDALGRVPRHEFVPMARRAEAYRNRPLPIGHGQTISQPYIVALMTEMLATHPGDRVLEIGTGSGYQAAILASLGLQVYSIEIIPDLGREASRRLARLGYTGVRTRIADGYFGWPEAAPFDAIIVTAASTQIPPPLIAQLKAGGRMVIPVGSGFFTQYLMLVEKDAAGQVHTRQLLPVRFVPFTGAH